MRPIHYGTGRLDRMLLGWAVLWLLAFPLFHIHPETDPHHGEAGHVHAAALHTIFSGDLEGEFGEQQESLHATRHLAAKQIFSTEGPHAWTTDPELSFSLLNDTNDRKLLKPLSTPLLFVTHNLQPLPARRDGFQEDGASTCTLTLFVRDIPARAPPSALLS